MTVFPPNMLDRQESGDNVVPIHPDMDINNIRDIVWEWVTETVITGAAAPNVYEIPKEAQPKKFKTFEEFLAALMSDKPTYTLPQQ